MTEFEKFQNTSITVEQDPNKAPPAPEEQKEPSLEAAPPVVTPTVEAAQEVMPPQPQTQMVNPPGPADRKTQPVAGQNLPQVKKQTIDANANGLIVARNLDEEYRICKIMSDSGMVPKGLATVEKVFVARQFAAELGLPMISALRNICVINGTPSLWGDLPLALCRMSGKLEKFEEYFADKNGNKLTPFSPPADLFAAVCVVKRRGEEERMYAFTEADVKTARLDTKDIWKLYPRRMRQMRTRGWALKDIFGDVLLGAGIAEYDHDVLPTEGGVVIDVEQPKKNSSSLNEKFAESNDTLQLPNMIKGD